MKTFFLDLLTGVDGYYSATKTWQNIGNTIASIILVYLAYTEKLNEMYFLIYLAVVAGSPIAKHIIYKGNDKNANTTR